MPELWARVQEAGGGEPPLKAAGPARSQADWETLEQRVGLALRAYGDSSAAAAAQVTSTLRLVHLHWHCGSGFTTVTLSLFGDPPNHAVQRAARRYAPLQAALRDVAHWLISEQDHPPPGGAKLRATLCLVADVNAYNRGRTEFGTDALSARGMPTLLAQFEAGTTTRHTRLVDVATATASL